MKTLKYTFWGSLVVLSALWWQADPTDWSSLHGLFAWRNVLNQYTGILGIGVTTGSTGAEALREAGAAEVLGSAAELPDWLAERGW